MSTLKNIPISLSILHEQEYNNILLFYKVSVKNTSCRRAFSESNNKHKLTYMKTQMSSMYNLKDHQVG
jgi:hypothetical protein